MRPRSILIFTVILVVFGVLAPVAWGKSHPDLTKLFHALHMVESGGKLHPKAGDHGQSIGPYQIKRSYWFDATHNSKGLKVIDGDYSDCEDKDYAEQIMIAYWARYCPKALAAGDFEVLARTHNGGLAGPRRSAALKYWKKVQEHL